MKNIKWLMLLLLSSCYLSADQFDACYKKALSTADNLACIDKEYKFYDKKLNIAYKKIRAKLSSDPREIKYLKEAQKAWIVYRDKKCKFEGYPMRDGTGELLMVYGCKTRETKRRAKELEEIVNELYSN